MATQITTTRGGLPGWASGPFQYSSGEMTGAQQNLPDISQLYTTTPGLNVPGLNDQQMNLINQMYAMGMNPGPNPAEQAGLSSLGTGFNTIQGANLNLPQLGTSLNLPTLGLSSSDLGLLDQFMPGANGVSAATNAAMNQFSTENLPILENTAANMGQANSGALLEAEARGAGDVMTPLLEQQNQLGLEAAGTRLSDILQSQGLQLTGAQDVANTNLASQGLQLQGAEAQAQQALNQGQAEAGIGGQQAQIGSQLYNQHITNLQNAFMAAGMPYDVALQRAQALYQQQQQMQQIGLDVGMGPFADIPSIYGTTATNTQQSGGGGGWF